MKLVLLLVALVGYTQALNLCSPCMELVQFIETEVTRDEPSEQKVLDAACTKITHSTGFINKLCDEAVNAGLKLAVHWLDTKQPPSVVCREAKLCSSFEQNPEDEAFNPQEFCPIARKLINVAKADINSAVNFCNSHASQLNIPPQLCQYLPAILKRVIATVNQLCPPSSSDVQSLGEQQLCPVLEKFLDYASKNEKAAETLCQKALAPYNAVGLCKDLPTAIKMAQFLVQKICASPASFQDFSSQDLCQGLAELTEILNMVKQLDPNLAAFVDKAVSLVKKIQSIACPSSSLVSSDGASPNICDALKEVPSICDEVVNLCKSHTLPANVCSEVDKVIPGIEEVDKILLGILQC